MNGISECSDRAGECLHTFDSLSMCKAERKYQQLLEKCTQQQFTPLLMSTAKPPLLSAGSYIRLATAIRHDQVPHNCLDNVHHWRWRRAASVGKQLLSSAFIIRGNNCQKGLGHLRFISLLGFIFKSSQLYADQGSSELAGPSISGQDQLVAHLEYHCHTRPLAGEHHRWTGWALYRDCL